MDTILPSEPATPAAGTTGSEVIWSGAGRLRRGWKIHACVFAVYLVVFLLMFRGLIRAIPDVLSDKAFIAAHELVPVFDFQKQFLDQISGSFSELTNAFEIRLRYALPTAWMRYYKIIPFALIITSILTAFANYLILLAFTSKVLKKDPGLRLSQAAALANLFAFFILLYTKILFYFSMIIGYTMFLLSLHLLIHALFYERRHPQRYMFAASSMYIANPTIHFLVLYIFLVILILPFAWFGEKAAPHTTWKEAAKTSPRVKWAISLVWLAFVGVLPYALFVKLFVLKGVGSLTDDIPVYHLFIKANSIPLLQFLSFDSGAITDGYLYGRYIPLYPRLTNIFYSILIFLPFAPSVFRRLFADGESKRSAWLLGSLFMISLWCSLGYGQSGIIPSFYDLLAWFMNGIYETQSTAVKLFGKGIEAFVQILRAPHRFQFIALAVGSVLMACGVYQVQERILALPWSSWKKYAVVGLVLPVAFFVPLLSNWDYRTALTSGDFAEYLAPFPTRDVGQLRDFLDTLPEAKTIILPPAGAQQRITDINGVQHKFLEKIFIHYLNKPSYYYGSDSPLFNKNSFFFILWALQNNQNWWINIIGDLDVRYIIIDKTADADNFSPKIYLSNLEKTLSETVDGSVNMFTKLYENESYSLYEFRKPWSSEQGDPIYFNGN